MGGGEKEKERTDGERENEGKIQVHANKFEKFCLKERIKLDT